MHLAVSVVLLLITWKRAALRQWREYHATMLYIIVCDLTYNYFCKSFPLWVYETDAIIESRYVTELSYTFVFLPLTALLFLAWYPRDAALWRKGVYIGLWIAVYMGWEGFFNALERISYDNGWSLVWSLAFYLEMFPMLLLHSRRPRLAYAASFAAAAVWIVLFRVPFH